MLLCSVNVYRVYTMQVLLYSGNVYRVYTIKVILYSGNVCRVYTINVLLYFGNVYRVYSIQVLLYNNNCTIQELPFVQYKCTQYHLYLAVSACLESTCLCCLSKN